MQAITAPRAFVNAFETANGMRLAFTKPNQSSPMKRLPVFAALFSLVLLVAARAADAPGAIEQQEQQVLAVVREVQNQQVAIAENQVKIEAKLATIAEYLRVARIYASRGGGKVR
jgi:hypothetical protein